MAVLYSFRVELRSAFSLFDLDNSGMVRGTAGVCVLLGLGGVLTSACPPQINLSEFRAGLAALGAHLTTCKIDNQMADLLFHHMDREG